MGTLWKSIGLALVLAAAVQAGTPEQAAAARKSYEAAAEAWQLKLKMASSDDERLALLAERPDAPGAARRMWTVIGGQLDEEWTLESAAWFLRLAVTQTESDENGQSQLVFAEPIAAVRRAVEQHHLQSSRLAPICMALVACADPESRGLLKRIEQENPDPQTSGVAALGLAMLAKDLGDEPEIMRERLTLLRKAIIDAADVEVEGVSVAGLAEEELYIIMNLSKGRQAPDLVGVDSGGRPMKLSDHTGKVLMLVFWNSRGDGVEELARMLRATREDERFRGGRFEVIGVNSDPVETLRGLQAEGSVDWPNFSDPENALGKQYRVGVWPLVYVLGTDRTIHYIGSPGTFAELTAAAVLQGE